MAKLRRTKYNTSASNVNFTYADYPSIKIYKGSTGSKWNNHLLFGDYIKIMDTEIIDGRVKARSRNSSGWVNVGDLSKERVLEVNFVDIGQGDGCHVVTPDDQHIIIDAGKSDNMNRYLSWRFNLYKRSRPLSFPFKVIISHSDTDHYKGFGQVFDNKMIRVNDIYHNGLVERPGRNRLGRVEEGYITGLVQTTAQMKRIVNKTSNRSGTGSQYCKTLYKSLKANPDVEFTALSVDDKYLEGWGDTNLINGKRHAIKILGPITKRTNGKDSLKTINNTGKDKNGHSVVMRLDYGKARILLGGDVNTEFGKIIHGYYKRRQELGELMVDVAKACHHGSNHFHYPFLEAINSSATVISSGDDESYSHPRPDTIGALGKCGYGEKPMIFSTELARSNKEITYSKLEGIAKLFGTLKDLKNQIRNEQDADALKVLKTKRTKTNSKINSFLTKFGMINVRTDGKRMIIAQKYEVAAAHGKWDIHQLKYRRSSDRFERDH